jgi:apolipoprotein N-acyltransferase
MGKPLQPSTPGLESGARAACTAPPAGDPSKGSGRSRLPTALLPLAAAGAGALLYGLSFPPGDHGWLAWFALVPLLVVVAGRPRTRAFLYGAVYGIACMYAVAGSWFPQAMARFLELPLLVGELGLLAYAAVFWGTAFGLFSAGAAGLVGSGRPVLAALAIAATWVATELLRGRVLEQPWALLGYSQHAYLPLIQISAVTAVYGVSFLLALGNATIAQAIVRRRARVRERLGPLGLAALFVAMAWLGGVVVLRQDLPLPRASVAIVQTNVPPAPHWTRAYTDRQIMEHIRATDELVPTRDVGLIVWPENAVPRHLEIEPGLAALLGGLAQRHGSDLLFGAARYADGKSYNSVRLITATGHYGGHYDKQRLVLVAEANPLRPPSSDASIEDPREFTAGEGPGVLQSFVPVGVSICHEVVFPELSGRAVHAGAELLVNVSNDGWLDPERGIGARQHFAMAAFRAVETRRYLVRAATTGISGIIDPFGRVVTSLDFATRDAIVAPVAGLSGMTPYVRLGDVFAFGCALVAVVVFIAQSTWSVPLWRRLTGGPWSARVRRREPR